MSVFDRSRIISRDNVPEFYVHGTRNIEMLDDNTVRIWICQDQPVAISGLAPMSLPVLRLFVPISAFVWNATAVVHWGFDHGILQRKPVGPTELRPTGLLMH